jgi:glycosyltransferase involved in cell wall biosynthesis
MVPGNASRAPNQDLKVLHVIPSISLRHGGPSYAIRSMAHASQRAGMEVVVATTDDDGNDARLDVPLGTPVVRDDVTHLFFRRDLIPYKVSFGLARWLNRNIHQFDIVHIHALFSFSSTAAAMVAWRKKVPYVVRPLGVLNRWGLEHRRLLPKRVSLRLIELPILRRAAAIHFTTERELREAADIGGDVTAGRSVVTPIPVEVNESGNAENFLQSYPSVTGKKLVLFLSRIDKKKGIELLLNAFAGVKRNEPNSLLVIAGNGDTRYVETLRAQADKLGISADILWAGFLGRPEKANAYAAASVFVLPSHSENFGIAAAEALAAGVPCVLSDQVALTDYLQDKDSALVVPCQSAAIANALCQLLSEPETREHLATQGRLVAAQLFSLQSVGEALADRYRSILCSRAIPENAV